jgi:hypothetical protein
LKSMARALLGGWADDSADTGGLSSRRHSGGGGAFCSARLEARLGSNPYGSPI